MQQAYSRLGIACLLMIAFTQFSFAKDLPPLSDLQALHVLNRLTYGPKPGDIEYLKKIGFQAYLKTQLNPNRSNHLSDGDHFVSEFIQARKDIKDDKADAKKKRKEIIKDINQKTTAVRLNLALTSSNQLEELMVDFWFNHFNVYLGKNLDRALVMSYEQDAIRPYALEHFRDLLGATAKHPAMLYYLDNWQSTATTSNAMNSPGKKRAANGLNENYARELMELHTLGVEGGYNQQDVTELARIFTGWTFDLKQLKQGSTSAFIFNDKKHDQGDKHWLKQTIKSAHQAEGEKALDILAMHPATAYHISYKLAQYFIADEPPASVVSALRDDYLQHNGDIRHLLETLFNRPEFMDPQYFQAKFKSPYRYLLSALRVGNQPITQFSPLVNQLKTLGMPLYECPTPNGYGNTQVAWLNPNGLTQRISFALRFALGKVPINDQPKAISANALVQTLGTTLSTDTQQRVTKQSASLQAALILGSPDFMHY